MMNVTLVDVLKVILGLNLFYWIGISLMVLSAHTGISKGEHPMYEQWVAMNPSWSYPLLFVRIGLYGSAYWIIAYKLANNRKLA